MAPYGVMQGTMMKMKKNTGAGDFSPTPKSGKKPCVFRKMHENTSLI